MRISPSPVSLNFDATPGATPAPQTLNVASTANTLQVNATANVTWLSIAPGSVNTPGQFRVSVLPAGLNSGIYQGSISLTAAGAQQVGVPVQLRVEGGPLITEILNGGSFMPEGAQNTWITIKGQNLASDPGRVWEDADFVSGNLPTELDGVRVNVNNKAAYVYFISPTQINVLSPADTSTGQIAVEVIRNNVRSNTAPILMKQLSPAFFQWPEGYVASTHADGSLCARAGLITNTAFTPAKPGETIVLYGTGFGPTTPPFPLGKAASGPATTTGQVVVRLNGIPVETSYSGLTQGFAGLYQLNIKVPDQMPDGKISVVAEIGGVTTQSGAFIAVQR